MMLDTLAIGDFDPPQLGMRGDQFAEKMESPISEPRAVGHVESLESLNLGKG